MDERKKRIDELVKINQESHFSLNTLLEAFGENLYSRTKDMEVNFDDINQYKVYLNDILESNADIGRIEEKNRRFKELEEAISAKEHDEKERAKEIAGIYRRLGKVLLENSAYDDFTAFFREQANALSSKLESLQIRIGELDNKDGSNVFSWIGKSAQGLVLKSFLSKTQENQEQLYYNVGERYSNRETASADDDASLILREIESLREISRSVQEELSILKDERQIITAGFGIDGNPQKQIQSVKNHIEQVRVELRNLYKNFGLQASGILDDDILPERKYFIDTIVTAEDGEIIGRAVRLNKSIIDNEKTIVKFRASLSIDEEKEKIEKYLRSIEDKVKRISDLENSIKSLEENVKDSEAYIQELQKQL